jgi:hypothetical protein
VLVRVVAVESAGAGVEVPLGVASMWFVVLVFAVESGMSRDRVVASLQLEMLVDACIQAQNKQCTSSNAVSTHCMIEVAACSTHASCGTQSSTAAEQQCVVRMCET